MVFESDKACFEDAAWKRKMVLLPEMSDSWIPDPYCLCCLDKQKKGEGNFPLAANGMGANYHEFNFSRKSVRQRQHNMWSPEVDALLSTCRAGKTRACEVKVVGQLVASLRRTNWQHMAAKHLPVVLCTTTALNERT